MESVEIIAPDHEDRVDSRFDVFDNFDVDEVVDGAYIRVRRGGRLHVEKARGGVIRGERGALIYILSQKGARIYKNGASLVIGRRVA